MRRHHLDKSMKHKHSTARAWQQYREASARGHLTGVLLLYQPTSAPGPAWRYLDDAGDAWLWLRTWPPHGVILGAWTTSGFDLEYEEGEVK